MLKMDWARLADGVKLLIYRTVNIFQENNQATFEFLQMPEGDVEAFHALYNDEEKIWMDIEEAHADYQAALSQGPRRMGTKRRKKRPVLGNMGEEKRLAELSTELASVKRGRKPGFRKVADDIEKQIQHLELSARVPASDSPSRTPSPDVEAFGFADLTEVYEAHVAALDALKRPTEYNLKEDDIRDGFRYIKFFGDMGAWSKEVLNEVARALVGHEGITFTWEDLSFAPIDDPENQIETNEEASEEDSSPADPMAAYETAAQEAVVQQVLQQIRDDFENSIVPGSAEHALSQQVRRREGYVPIPAPGSRSALLPDQAEDQLARASTQQKPKISQSRPGTGVPKV